MDPTKTLGTVQKLTGKESWQTWKSDMELTLGLNGTWKYVNGTKSLPTEVAELKDLRLKLDVATYCLKFSCDAANRLLVAGKEDPVEIYSTFKEAYEGDTPAKRMSLRRRLYHLTHDPSEPVTAFITAIRTITTDLASIGHALKPDEIRDVVLMNLHTSFDTIATILASLDKNDGKEWTLDALSIRLADWEEAHNSKTGHSGVSEAAHYSTARYGSAPHHHGRSHSPSGDNWFNKLGIPGACTRCGQLKHSAESCFRDMPEYAKQQALNRRRNGNFNPESANNTMAIGSARPPLTIPTILSTVRNGLSYILNKDYGVIYEGNDVVGSLRYHGNNIYSDVHIPASTATANLAHYPHDSVDSPDVSGPWF
jgi:gag-polypeptide of LTR copia-type